MSLPHEVSPAPSALAREPHHQRFQHENAFEGTSRTLDFEDDDAEPSTAIGTVAFEQAQLLPRGIRISLPQIPIVSVWRHFQTIPLNEHVDRRLYYRSLPGLEDTSIWLQMDDILAGEIVDEWAAMEEYDLNEGDRETTAYELVLKRERRHPGPGPKTEVVMPERIIKMGIKPRPTERWTAPPLLEEPMEKAGNSEPWAFDICPDALYWISLNRFSIVRTRKFRRFVTIFNDRVLLPYLTVEHKPNDTAASEAQHQIATSAALILYNRLKLKKTRQQRTGEPFMEIDSRSNRHYGLAMMGSKWSIWLIEANATADGDWQGCTMLCLDDGNMSCPEIVRILADWLNEIHRWGLTVWGTAVLDDLNACVDAAEPGIRKMIPAGNEMGGEYVGVKRQRLDRGVFIEAELLAMT